ncbi:MAG: class I SAM-dependent rRNA methyltransferase [Chloroflexi bacterium]|nr:class I SAM-dependent rRNA methyltransferase [Chloroflexota bacterium]
MMSERVILLRGKERALHNRHPWVFSGAIARAPQVPPGSLVEVHADDSTWLARGYYNRHSQIALRLLTWEPSEAIDDAFWQSRLQAAIQRRAGLYHPGQTTALRLVYAESDALPGLIVDRYDNWLILQALTAGIDRIKQQLAEWLLALTGCRGVYERSDADVRSQEGLRQMNGLLVGSQPPNPVRVLEHGLTFEVDTLHGHKTGFYLDQRENRRLLVPYCADARVLNAFAYTGGFGVYAAAAGAREVVNLDSSADALARAERNIALNAPDASVTSLEGDAFTLLRELRARGEQFDMVILDPPKFVFSRNQLEQGLRGYKDILLLGMQLVRPDGLLAGFSCSGLVSRELYQKVAFGASLDAGRQARILAQLSQSQDHPVLLTFPEAAYLKGLLLRIE